PPAAAALYFRPASRSRNHSVSCAFHGQHCNEGALRLLTLRSIRSRKGRFMAEASVVIGPRGVDRLRSGHRWVYRSDVRGARAAAGDIVRVTDERGRFHGRAFYSDKSQIAIRLLTHQDVPIDRSYFAQCIRDAAEYRKIAVQNSDAFRLIYGESD